MGDEGSYPALRVLLLILATAAIAIPLGRALPAADGLEYSAPVQSLSVQSQDFFLTPVPDFHYQPTPHPVPFPSTSSPVPFPPPSHKSFFTRAMAPYERLLRSCFLDDVPSVGDCLKEKVILALRRASSLESVSLGESVALVKEDQPEFRTGGEGEEERRNDTDGTVEDVDSRLIKGVAGFLRGRALRMSLPESIVPLVQQSLEEARGKKHKHLGTLITCVAVILKTLAIATIAFIAKKALLVGKLALILSAALLAKKLIGGGVGGGAGGLGTSFEVVSLNRRSHLRDMPRHGEVYPVYATEDVGIERGGGDPLAYGGYALLRRGKMVGNEWSDRVNEELRGGMKGAAADEHLQKGL